MTSFFDNPSIYPDGVFAYFYKEFSDRIGKNKGYGDNVIIYNNNISTILSNSDLNFQNFNRRTMQEVVSTLNETYVRRYNENNISVIKIVSKLQKYVVDNYKDVNLFLEENEILVNSNFADISSNIGFIIDEKNIEPDTYDIIVIK